MKSTIEWLEERLGPEMDKLKREYSDIESKKVVDPHNDSRRKMQITTKLKEYTRMIENQRRFKQ
jgi:hypothetical protein